VRAGDSFFRVHNMNIRDLLYDFASTGRESYGLTDKALTRIVTALRRDPEI
jgi:hypothetical protein